MDELEPIRRIFTACDRDGDGFLDRRDLEEVCKEIGIDKSNIPEIFEQCGAKESGQISFLQFCSLKTVIINEMQGGTSSSESSPEYSTDNTDNEQETKRDGGRAPPPHTNPPAVPTHATVPQNKSSGRTRPVEPDQTQSNSGFSSLDRELAASGVKMKKIQEMWQDVDPNVNPHRRSGGGIEDYLDDATLQHLKDLELIDPNVPLEQKNIGGGVTTVTAISAATGQQKLKYPTATSGAINFPMPSTYSYPTISSTLPSADVRVGDGRGGNGGQPDYLELTNRLHLAALTSYKNEIYDLTARLHHIQKERDGLRSSQNKWNIERQKLQRDYEDKLQSQTMRVTELQSVIAELTRKLSEANGNKIVEEDEEEDYADDDDARSNETSDMEVQGSHDGSQCSCDRCVDAGDGPNQISFLAITDSKEVTGTNIMNDMNLNNFDVTIDRRDHNSSAADADGNLKDELSRVIGALESTIAERKPVATITPPAKIIEPEVDATDGKQECQSGTAEVRKSVAGSSRQAQNTMKLIANLKQEKKQLEKQLNQLMVQGYMKSNNGQVAAVQVQANEEMVKLQADVQMLRASLERVERENEDVKVVNVRLREERDAIRKKARTLQEALESGSKIQHIDPDVPPFQHQRSQSLHSPSSGNSQTPPNRSGSPVPAVPNRSSSLDSRSIQSLKRPPKQAPSPPATANQTTTISGGMRVNLASPFAPVCKPSAISPDEGLRRTGSGHRFSSPEDGARRGSGPGKGTRESPSGSLTRGGVVESSDLGSSIGDDMRNDLSQTLTRILHGRVPETLLQTLMTYHNLEQVLHTLSQHYTSEVEDKGREGSIEIERLESRLAHLQSQNDLLQLSLDECKHHAEQLTMLCAKYESNSTAWSLALQNTEQLIETYEVMLQLQESEADIVAANCQAAGLGHFDTLKSLTSTKSSQSNISAASSLASAQLGYGEEDGDTAHAMKHSHSRRKDAETQAKYLLHKLDKKYENSITGENESDPTGSGKERCHDDLSYQSRTSTGSSQNSTSNVSDTLSKHEELRLRDYIQLLKSERVTYQGTIAELESVHGYSDLTTEKLSTENMSEKERLERTHGLNIDLETAVILQEMQALKEERAELKHRIYLLDKEKRALELKISSQEAQEQAYLVHIEHLKGEVKEQLRKRKQLMKDGRNVPPAALPEDETLSMSSGSTHHTTPSTTLAELSQYSSTDEIPADMLDAARRERKLKARIQELVDTLEKLAKNSEIRHLQTAEYIADLKKANGALVTAYEKAKKRHANRLKKFEHQLVQMSDKYQEQVRILKERITSLEERPEKKQTETSL